MYEEVHYGRLYEQIVDQVEKRILSGELNPGDKLPPERELVKQFGVSRTAVREAIKALSQKGLIAVYPGRGTFVIDSTSSAVRHSLDMLIKVGGKDGVTDLVEVREILEPEIAALAANRATEEQIMTIQETVATMENAMEDPNTFVEADLDFHLALAQATNNALIPALIDSLIDLLRQHRMRAAAVEGALQRGQPFHKLIIDAIRRKDEDSAREAMRAHLKQIRQEMETALEDNYQS
jgi:GntR family transcriptional repressor for pyruvate dehydrogenase complex